MKGHWTVSVIASILIIGGISFMQTSDAVITEIITIPGGPCDPLDFWDDSDEIGTAGIAGGSFPFGEELLAASGATGFPPCSTISPGGPHALVSITNLNSEAYTDVYYVGDDPETVFTNVDGLIGGISPPGDGPGIAFRIDAPWSVVFQPPLGSAGCGVNCPLVSEDMTVDGIWEPTETWEFVIQDYFNPGAPASAFDSIGVTSLTFSLDPPALSSGSILVMFDDHEVGGTIIPIDSTALLVAGAETLNLWLILGVMSAAGIGIAIFTLKRNR